MYISKFQIFNYKSFKDSTWLEFKPGINVIIGQNNVGKTAFLEALELRFSDHPHKNIRKLQPQKKRQFSPFTNLSTVNSTFTFDKSDIYSGIETLDIFVLSDEILERRNLSLLKEWSENPSVKEFCFYDYSPNSVYNYPKIKTDIPENIDIYFPGKEKDWEVTFSKNIKKIIINDENDIDIAKEDIEYIVGNSIELKEIFFDLFKSRIYRFESERFHIGSCSIGTNSKLEPNASNLAEVISQLQARGNRDIYQKFNYYINIIFPDIKSVSAELNPKTSTKDDEYEILVWSPEADQEDIKDFALPLSQCGTGVSQVLAILYVVITASESQVIIIDEPQSFLHPSAAKKLIEILKEFPQHQYFIATHSPQIITAANPATIVQLSYIDGETKAQIIDAKQTAQLRSLLDDLGVSLSDVFGADNILWVEGPTEEKCFPLILEELTDIKLRGTQILAVQNTGDLEGKHADLVFDIYDKLSGGNTLFPPAIGFILDEEGRTQQKKEDLKRRSEKNGNKLQFLTRKLYENYLLEPEAIAHVINQEDCSRDQPISENEIQSWLDVNKNQFIKGTSEDPDWLKVVDGANLLKKLFSEKTDNKVSFIKTKHSPELTEWLLKNKSDSLQEIAALLRDILTPSSNS
ncbi:RecF/RecN/SMC N terminal domain protein [Planktothrix serta PCC 8927]|uniref:RecF/RecN/SMC N terminal domain protein n=1 Tax=Planktothrix serta PCC 8927 TaxID=671068 RepID=A0A7Z9BZ79_9CYAN|nr:AAA family ATPase [Planktothrix serta]VXD24863.1 RecF/RecN/SMC N terminal domain protein [Planktothrix serta PCC 8927]